MHTCEDGSATTGDSTRSWTYLMTRSRTSMRGPAAPEDGHVAGGMMPPDDSGCSSRYSLIRSMLFNPITSRPYALQSQSRDEIMAVEEVIAIPLRPGDVRMKMAKDAVPSRQEALRSWVLIESHTSRVQLAYHKASWGAKMIS
mgnify:CR=1 FL=1